MRRSKKKKLYREHQVAIKILEEFNYELFVSTGKFIRNKVLNNLRLPSDYVFHDYEGRIWDQQGNLINSFVVEPNCEPSV